MNPSYDFSGRGAFVTGASSGVGLATARTFVEAGAAVVLADVDEQALQTAETQLRDAGHHVLATRCDVANEEQVARGPRNHRGVRQSRSGLQQCRHPNPGHRRR